MAAPRRVGTLAALLMLAALAAGCEDESFRELRPALRVCVEERVTADGCDRDLDLGERHIGVPVEVELYLHNRGDAPLNVTSISCAASTVALTPDRARVEPGAAELVTVTVTPDVLGARRVEVEIVSDDEERSPTTIGVDWIGLPEPIPVIELCVDSETGEDCGTALALPFGSVRRSQRESRTVTVRNIGSAPLQIEDVSLAGRSSVDGEFAIATSTRPGALPVGAEARVVVVYQPADAGDDQVELRVRSDDPAASVATVTMTGSSVANLPPTADARQAGTGATSLEVAVGDTVALDGSGSSDPEGDPLLYSWRLLPPAQSVASLDDPGAALVTFEPDRAGSYRVELVVEDSLGQASELIAVVLIQALPRDALSAVLTWQAGGDLDLHLVPAGAALFSGEDCYFDNPAPDLGAVGDPGDDPLLRADAVSAPGVEEIVIAAPAPGRYGLYVQYFDDTDAGAAVAAVRVTFNDASFPALQDTRSLPQRCALWHVGDVIFPDARIETSGAAVTEQCYQ